MKDVLMDMFKFGLGAADMTREQAEALVAKLQERYKDEIADGRVMVDDLLEQAAENSRKLNARVKVEVEKAIKAQKLVDEQDLKELAANVKELARTTQKVAARATKNTATMAKRTAKKAYREKKKRAKKTAKKSAKKKTVKKAKKKPAKKAKKVVKKARRSAKKR